MKIAIIGAGAMGSIYGGHLSLHNEVYLVDINQTTVDEINTQGLKIDEDGTTNTYHPKAVTSTVGLGCMDLVIIFVKALFTKVALKGNQKLIGDHTYLLTLQNGSGHEDILSEFVPMDRILIGTTEDNGNILATAHINRGGVGNTNIGMLVEDTQGVLTRCKESFDACGFNLKIHDNIQQLIWDKLFINVSLSALTGVLQVPMGFIADDPYAWKMAERLVKEAIEIANASGMKFDYDYVIAKVKATSSNNKDGYTSIYADLKNKRKTEVDTISGSVVRAAKKIGMTAPTHEWVVDTIHAMEAR